MTDLRQDTGEMCGCSSTISDAQAEECSVCTPKLALTLEEESILAEMRAIKEQVRPIADRIKNIEQSLKDAPEQQHEWTELSHQLQDLRVKWKEWEDKLELAIERKLILLGHRDPKA